MQFSRKKIVALVLALNSFFACFPCFGEEMPSDQQMVDALKKFQKSTSTVLKTTKHEDFRSQGVTVNVPSIPGATPPSQAKTDNLQEVIKRYKLAQEGEGAFKNRVDLMVFVSFSMPPDVLQKLSLQAKEAGAILVLRGFKNGSFKETVATARGLNPGNVEWEIHPEAFKVFKVKSVPTFVVANAAANSVADDGCAPPTSYAAITGNISIELALRTIARRADKNGANMAEVRLKKLEEYRKKH